MQLRSQLRRRGVRRRRRLGGGKAGDEEIGGELSSGAEKTATDGILICWEIGGWMIIGS